MNQIKEPILGQAFNDILNELHAHAFSGVPDESDPFILTILEREYIAYVISCYYQCEHCQRHHGRAIETLLAEVPRKLASWQTSMIDATLLLRAIKTDVSPLEWERWVKLWDDYAKRLDAYHPCLASYIAYAIGIARKDTDLMELAFGYIKQQYPGYTEAMLRIRDIDRVVIFMKAATSKNRTDPTLFKHIRSLRASL
jgi:hypothetical protein